MTPHCKGHPSTAVDDTNEPMQCDGSCVAPRKLRRGFNAMPPEQQRLIAQKGGRTARDNGTAYRFTREAAQRAAAKSVEVRKAKREAAQ